MFFFVYFCTCIADRWLCLNNVHFRLIPTIVCLDNSPSEIRNKEKMNYRYW